MSHFANQQCAPCPEGSTALSIEESQSYLSEIPHWTLSADNKSITRRVDFKNYYETIAFVNALAWMAHQEDHHPDLEVHYNYCVIRYNTHTVNGLSNNDFICAAKINMILGA